jgi:redox-regulated HSP33 family molecular chaperone
VVVVRITKMALAVRGVLVAVAQTVQEPVEAERQTRVMQVELGQLATMVVLVVVALAQ